MPFPITSTRDGWTGLGILSTITIALIYKVFLVMGSEVMPVVLALPQTLHVR